MNDLVFVENGRLVTESLIVAEVFGKEHKNVLRDIEELGCSAEFSRLNFEQSTYVNERGREYPRIIMTEQGLVLLVMGYTGDKAMEYKERYIAEFDRMRAELAKPRMLTRLELIDMARESELGRIEAEQKLLESDRKNAEMQAQLQEAAPKLMFADAVTTSHNTILIRELAVILKQNGVEMGQNRLFEELRERGYLIKRNGTDRNMPTQRSMELGLFQVKETPIIHSDGQISVSKTPKVTGRGQVYFVNLFKGTTNISLAVAKG